MMIRVYDTFGTHVGDAEVRYRQAGRTDKEKNEYVTGIIREVLAVFDQQPVSVNLPTRNALMPWRLEVRFDD